MIRERNLLDKSNKNCFFKALNLDEICRKDDKEKVYLTVKQLQKHWEACLQRFTCIFKVIFSFQVLYYVKLNLFNFFLTSNKFNNVKTEQVLKVFKRYLTKSWFEGVSKKITILRQKAIKIKSFFTLSPYFIAVLIGLQIVAKLIFDKNKNFNAINADWFLKNASRYKHLNVINSWNAIDWVISSSVSSSKWFLNILKYISKVTRVIYDSFFIKIIYNILSFELNQTGKLSCKINCRPFSLKLSGIILNELDFYITVLKEKILTPKFRYLIALRKKNFYSKKELIQIIAYNYFWLYYMWNYNNYVIAFKGHKTKAILIIQKLNVFLTLHLGFKATKNGLSSGADCRIKILGFVLQFWREKDWIVVKSWQKLSSRKLWSNQKVIKEKLKLRLNKIRMKQYTFSKGKALKSLCKRSFKGSVGALSVLDGKKLVNVIRFLINTKLKIINYYEWSHFGLLNGSGFKEINKSQKVMPFRIVPVLKDNHRILSYTQPRFAVSLDEFKNKLRKWGILSKTGKPGCCYFLVHYTEIFIIEFFTQKVVSLLDFFKQASNFYKVKKLINYYFRGSLLHTLAAKYSSKIYKIVLKYGWTPTVFAFKNKKRHVVAKFLTRDEILFTPWGFNVSLWWLNCKRQLCN